MERLQRQSAFERIQRPQLVVDREKCRANIRRMLSKANAHVVTLRPHFKTHQSVEIGELYRQEGIEHITVSSVQMAQFFADNGWSDITIAFPVNLREIDGIRKLNRQIRLTLLVESTHAVRFLDEQMDSEVNVCIEVDTGYGRTGIDWRSTAELEALLDRITGSRMVRLAGLLAHNGHTYHAQSANEVLEIHESSIEKLVQVRRLAENYQPDVRISLGDTPACSLSEFFEGVDEIRPGNFVYYDLQQRSIGSCTFEQIAVVVACPVVSVQKRTQKIIVYGGAVHLSKQSMQEQGQSIHGLVVSLSDGGWREPIANTYVASVSQEHGIIHCRDAGFLAATKPGDLVGIVPVHSCLAANLLPEPHFI